MSDHPIIWHNEVADEIKGTVKKDIDEHLSHIKHPSQVVFHTVFLGGDMDGPCVMVWGLPDDDSYHAEYHEFIEYTNMTIEEE